MCKGVALATGGWGSPYLKARPKNTGNDLLCVGLVVTMRVARPNPGCQAPQEILWCLGLTWRGAGEAKSSSNYSGSVPKRCQTEGTHQHNPGRDGGGGAPTAASSVPAVPPRRSTGSLRSTPSSCGPPRKSRPVASRGGRRVRGLLGCAPLASCECPGSGRGKPSSLPVRHR